MRLIWPIIKDTAVYFWEELFYLVLFNLFTVLSIAPGAYILLSSPRLETPPPLLVYVPISVILWSAVPYTFFGFFWTVYEISEGKAIRFSIFFAGGKKFLKHAYIWWGINIAVIALLMVNITFYQNLQTTWSIYPLMLFVGLFLTWLLTQLFALTMYPRLIEPGFKMATINALAIIAKQPLPILFTGLLTLVFAIAGIIIIPVGWFISAALIATLLNMTTRKILQATLAPPEAETDG